MYWMGVAEFMNPTELMEELLVQVRNGSSQQKWKNKLCKISIVSQIPQENMSVDIVG